LLKISIITVCFNSDRTIKETIESVLEQNYANIEYIIIDGGSEDKTISIIESFGTSIYKIISEKDDGYYDALNKGLALVSGGVVGILNSDDVLSDNGIISSIVKSFENNQVDIVWGDVVFIDKKNKVKRLYSGRDISPSSFNNGIMPPHPSVFIKKNCYEKFGYFNTKYRIAADYDLLLRFLKLNNLRYFYMPKVLVKMKLGGVSNRSFSNVALLNKEIYEIHKSNGVPISIFNLMKKIPRRIMELVLKP